MDGKGRTHIARKDRKSISKNNRPLLFWAASTVSPRPCFHQKSPVHQPITCATQCPDLYAFKDPVVLLLHTLKCVYANSSPISMQAHIQAQMKHALQRRCKQ